VDYSDNFDGVNRWASAGQVNLWELGAPTGAVINSAFSTPKAWATDLNGVYPPGTTEYLYSPYILIPAAADTATLEFKQWMDVQSTHGYGRLQYSINGGSTWVNLGFIGSAGSQNWYNTNIGGVHSWSSNTTGWVTSSYKLPKTTFNTGNPVQFRFIFLSDGFLISGDGWGIDDFKITVPSYPTDARTDSISSPSLSTITGDSIQVTATFANAGTNTLANIPVAYKLSTGLTVLDTIMGPFAQFASITYSFPSKYVSPGADYSLCVYTHYSGDQNHQNDTICIQIVALPGAYDAGVTRIITPGTSSSNTTTVSIRIKNYGTNALSSIPLFYKVGLASAVQETWNGNLAPDDSTDYTFATTYQSPVGIYNLCAGTELGNDANPNNDDFCKTVSSNVGLDGLSGNPFGLLVYPNPTSSTVTIEFQTQEQERARLRLVDMVGRTVLLTSVESTIGTNQTEINLSNLPNGVYTLIVDLGKQSAKTKVSILK